MEAFPGGAARHPYVALRTGPEAQCEELCGLLRIAGAKRQMNSLARLQLARAVDPLHRGDRLLRVLTVHTRPDQQRHQRIATTHPDRPGVGGRRGLSLERGQ